MKRIFLFLLVLIMHLQLWSQDASGIASYPNELRVGFFQFFMNTFFLEYEHMFKNNTGVVLQGGMTLKKDSYEEIIGGQTGIQFRIYTERFNTSQSVIKVESGYLGPYFKYRYLDVTDLDGAEINSSWVDGRIYNIYRTFGGGIVLGLKVVALQRLAFDLNLGGGLQFTDAEEETIPDYALDMFGIAYTGVAPVANFSFGIRF